MRSGSVSAATKLRVFMPQVLTFCLCIGAATGAAALDAHHSVFEVTAVIVSVLTGLSGVVTAIAKMLEIDSHGWESYCGTCENCERLSAEVSSLRRALLEMKP